MLLEWSLFAHPALKHSKVFADNAYVEYTGLWIQHKQMFNFAWRQFLSSFCSLLFCLSAISIDENSCIQSLSSTVTKTTAKHNKIRKWTSTYCLSTQIFRKEPKSFDDLTSFCSLLASHNLRLTWQQQHINAINYRPHMNILTWQQQHINAINYLPHLNITF